MPPHRPLAVGQIRQWAGRHRARPGECPSAAAGPVKGVPGERWEAVNWALAQGLRGLPGGSSLPLLLAERRGRRLRSRKPPLTVGQVRGWAERHLRRTGRWPTAAFGPVADAPGENWRALNLSLWKGHRGLPRRLSLARLLREHRRGAGRQTAGG
jgi:hypothetical protein